MLVPTGQRPLPGRWLDRIIERLQLVHKKGEQRLYGGKTMRFASLYAMGGGTPRLVGAVLP
ncbi:MAG: hypothetical protein U0822_19480 [Anaerolineae bacterium]